MFLLGTVARCGLGNDTACCMQVARPKQLCGRFVWKNNGVVYLHGGAGRCLMRDVLWGGAVGTMAGPPAQGGMQILGGVPLLDGA